MSILESIGCGLPVIATPNTGFPEINEVGIEVTPGDSDAIAEAIIALLTDPKLAMKKSKNTGQIITKYYWNQIAKNFLKVYKRLS